MSHGTASSHGSARVLPQCYPSSLDTTKPSLADKFCDLDDADDFATCNGKLLDENAENFVVDFGAHDAWAAFDLDAGEFTALLDSRRDTKGIDTRWINIWAPEKQKETVQAITSYYDISARLRAMMGSDPSITKKTTPIISPKLTAGRQSMQHEKEERFRATDDLGEVENGYAPQLMNNQAGPVELDNSGLNDISFSQIVNQIWHFVSLDYGPKYMCCGYNSLYAIPDMDFRNDPGLPEGKRVWSWLVLCDDGTVISIQENPFPHEREFDVNMRRMALQRIRRHVNLVFRGISKLHEGARNANPLMKTQVREFSDTAEKGTVRYGEGPSLLFYYLFDDWMSNYSLVIKREHSYSTTLDELRKGMLERARVELIDDLHRLGRQLGVLKRLYQSYQLIVNRIVKRQRRLQEEKRTTGNTVALPARARQLQDVDGSRNDKWRTVTFDEWDPTAPSGVELCTAAAARFERLADRIALYALSEIEECLTEKEGLTFLVFNLIAMKDSQAVERLTRVTILLAKVTILFMPISLATGYFSTEIRELQNYTAETYWATFAVVLCLSVILLTSFSWIAGSMEGRPIYRSMARAAYDATGRFVGRRKERAQQQQDASEKAL